MSTWYRKVQGNLGEIVSCIDHFENELDQARIETTLKGNVEKNSRDMPGIVEHRFNQLQEIEAILEHLNIELRKLRSSKYRKFLEHYNRQLTSRDVEKYIEGEQDVVDLTHLINEFALLRNKYIGLTKALDAKQFQLNNIIKLRAAGLEDLGL
tara:strand:+ start:1598 stop:2056 length:459 start_codon:yes stop_codon:yes gene_type:complete